MGIGPKSETRDYEVPMGKRPQRHQLTSIAETVKKTFLPTRNVFHSRAQFFNIKREDGETLDEYWKRLVDIERKCKFTIITPLIIITDKFAASINDKKARDKFIKGPLKLKLILEAIELDNYNHKYRDKLTKFKRQQNNSSESTSEDDHVGNTKTATKKKSTFTGKKKTTERNCLFVGRASGYPI